MRVTILAALCVAAAVALLVPSASALTCSAALQRPGPFAGACTQDWQSLKPLMRPTQMQVGYAWVRYKLDNDFDSQSDAQAQISSKTIPTVVGPDGGLYIVDDHHNLAALDYSGFSSVVVSVQVMCDKRNETVQSFWADLVQNNLVYLGFYPAGQQTSVPTTVQPSSLANRFSFTSTNKVFTDDTWRSIAGFARKVKDAPPPAPDCTDYKYCNRCMDRLCAADGAGISYFEFAWGYYFVDTTFNATSWWPDTQSLQSFATAYKALPPSDDLDNVDTDPRVAAAALVVPLCRAPTVTQFAIPPALFAGQTVLPGAVPDYRPLPADPDCAVPPCVRH